MAKKKAEQPKEATNYADRVVGFERIPVELIDDNAKNWRHHPLGQEQMLEQQLKTIGIADVGMVRKLPSGRYELINGHLRKRKLRQPFPCIVVDLSDDEADNHLLHLDLITSMAESIADRVKALMATVKPSAEAVSVMSRITKAVAEISNVTASTQAATNAVVSQVAAAAQSDVKPPDSPKTSVPVSLIESVLTGGSEKEVPAWEAKVGEDYRGIYIVREDVVFPTSNQWGIPDLLPNMLADMIPTETWARQTVRDSSKMLFLWNRLPPEQQRHWSKAVRSQIAGGILGFYLPDAAFEVLWTECVQVLARIQAQNWGAVCTPDFSLVWNWPMAINIFNLYRSRWVARYLQDLAVPIIPSMVSIGRPDMVEMTCAGLPQSPPVVFAEMRCGAKEADDLIRKTYAAEISAQLKYVKPKKAVFYGGRSYKDFLEPLLPTHVEYFWLESWNDARRREEPSY